MNFVLLEKYKMLSVQQCQNIYLFHINKEDFSSKNYSFFVSKKDSCQSKMVKLEMITIFCVVVVLQMLNGIEGTVSHHYWYKIDKCTCPYAEKNKKGIQWTWRVRIKDLEVFPQTPVHGYHSMRVTLIEACKNTPKTYMGYAKVHMARECFDRFHFKESETYLLSGYQKHINGIDRWIIDYCSPNRVSSEHESCNYPHQEHYCGYNCREKCYTH